MLELTLDEAIERGLDHNLGLILGQEERARGGGRARRGALRPAAAPARRRLRRAPEAQPGRVRLLGLRRLPGADRPVQRGRRPGLRLADRLRPPRHPPRAVRGLEREGRASSSSAAPATRWCWPAPASTCRRWRARAASTRRRRSSRPPRRSSTSPRIASRPGLVPGVDVLRAQVELAAQRQRLIVAETEAAKQKLALARAIGLPLGQDFQPGRRHALLASVPPVTAGAGPRERRTRRAPTCRRPSRASARPSGAQRRRRAKGCRRSG